MAVLPLDEEITNTVDSLQSQLFTSLQGGNNALSAFLSIWQAFELKIQSCANALQAETLDRVFGFSSMVTSVCIGAAEALSLGEEVCNEVSQELDNAIVTCRNENTSSKHGLRSGEGLYAYVLFQEVRHRLPT